MSAGLGGGGLARRALPPLLLGVAVLIAWEAFVVVREIDAYLLPSPSAIWANITAHAGILLAASMVTGFNALVGLVVGSLVGIALALAAAGWRTIDELVAPLVAGLAVVPIVALAPVLYTMFGANAQTARQLVAAIAVFVPVFVTTLRGLRQTAPVHRDLMRALAASQWQTMRVLTIPTAKAYVFTGIRIGTSLAVISSLVAEYFGGPRGGLGSFITSSAAQSDYARAWSYVAASMVLGLGAYLAALALEAIASRHTPAART